MSDQKGASSSSAAQNDSAKIDVQQQQQSFEKSKSNEQNQDMVSAPNYVSAQQSGYSIDPNQFNPSQFYNPFQAMSANPEHFMQMQMQLQYQMQLQQMQQQGGGVLADMMAVQSNMSSNPYAGMMHNPYFTNFAMHMQGMPPPAGVAPSMQMPVLQMPGIMATGPTIPNTSSQQLDGSVSGSGAVPSGIALIKVEGANSSLPTKPQHLPQQQFDAAAGSYPFYPYMPLVNPYMYMGMGMPQIGDPSYDPFKGKYHGMGMGMGMPNYGMGTFASPSPAGMNPKPHPPGSSSSQTIAQSNIDKLLPSDVDSANASVLVISWITILEEFDKRYDVVFESCSAKIHLDTSKTIIDGAKGRWRHVTLLDTLIAYGLGRERSKEDCERRRFNQYLALEEAVCFACAEALIWHSTELFSTSGTSNTTNPYMCTVTDIPLAWSTTENLKMDLLHQSSKSWKKRKDAVDILCKQWLVLEIGLHILITSVVNRIYNQHYVNHSCHANRNRGNRNLVEETDAALFDFCQAVTTKIEKDEKNKAQSDKLKRKR